MIGKWMEEDKLGPALEKTEALILQGKGKRNHITFRIERMHITSKKSFKYLRVLFDIQGSYGEYVKKARKQIKD